MISGYAELLLDQVAQNESLSSEVSSILSASRRAEVLVQSILAFSRKTDIKQDPLNLNEVVKHSGQIIKRTIPKMIEVDIRPGQNLDPILGDAYQLEQVLLNLANNASDAMEGGGRLTIETANVVLQSSRPAGQAGAAPGHYVLMSVSDTGMAWIASSWNTSLNPFTPPRR